ncbi:NifB/NifX family molybdenum-iron cluster-binding protein [bacterium]|nr:NifB/NifX family molybdenum-iron cluster-binding protein [candidate division CSSED10-310 bacterium]
MKILITASHNAMDAPVDSRFGRAPWFAVVDLDTDSIVFVENSQNLNAMQGAGIQSGQNAVQLGVSAVITGHVGPKAFTVLQAAGITIHQAPVSTVTEAVDQFRNGMLPILDTSDKPGHW